MSERKVLNKYYPPDFDPSKIPRMKLPKNRQYTVRLMAPFNMRCATCGEYIYKGKKFNARKEDVEHEDYLGIRIYRFYIKCTRCLQEISFKTDPKNTDYEIEAGATRNFMALKLAEEQAKKEEDELKEEEANNPMKLLENRTEQSRNEIALLESLEELKDLNRRQATVDYDTMLKQFAGETQEQRRLREQKEDDEFIKSVKFQNAPTSQQKRIVSEEIVEDVSEFSNVTKKIKTENLTDDQCVSQHTPSSSMSITKVTNTTSSLTVKPSAVTWNKSVGIVSRKNNLSGLVKVKSKAETVKSEEVTVKTESSSDGGNTAGSSNASTNNVVSGGLSLLAGYSDSDSNSDTN